MKIGACSIKLSLRGARSLKEKRRVIRAIKDRVKNKFNISVAEIGDQNLWGSIHIGIAATGPDARYLEALMRQTVNFIESMYLADMIDHQIEVIHLENG